MCGCGSITGMLVMLVDVVITASVVAVVGCALCFFIELQLVVAVVAVFVQFLASS